ncbi:MAG TPA: LamG domain-containing protein, partial [Dongiaceae bacterium]|nr:LamG domain-containing protein [Dongiaceae bacterium]
MGPLRARGATAPFGGAQNILTNSTDTNTFYAGPLPAAGQWARLSVPAGAVGLQARLVQGISFAVDGGAAAWDRAGKLVLEPVTNGVATSQGQGGAGPLYPNPVCVNPPANLVGWWRGEGNCNDWKNLDNGTGQGTGLTFPPGEVGYCFSLDGNTADIFVGATTTLDVGNNGSPGFTIEGWINPLDLNSRPIVEWNNPNAPTPYGVHFWISVGAPAGTGTGCLFANLVGIDGANHWVPTAAGLLTAGPGVWHHVALTYNESTYTGCIYLDGVLQASVPFAAFTPETAWDLYFGARVAPSFEVTRWYGGLDEISLYNRALGAAEISSIYNASSAGKCPAGPSCYTAPTPVSWWPAEGTCADSVGANTGYAEGASFSYAPGEVNQAFSLYAGAFVWVHASSSLDVGQGSFTLEAWIYPADTVNRPIFEWNSGQGSIPYGVHLWTSEPAPWGNGPGCLFANLVDCYGDDQWVITQGNLFVPGAWLHVALVYDAIGGYGYIYVDGQQQACARVLNCPQTTPPLFMGARLAPQSEVTFWSGKIDEATLYNEALAQ